MIILVFLSFALVFIHHLSVCIAQSEAIKIFTSGLSVVWPWKLKQFCYLSILSVTSFLRRKPIFTVYNMNQQNAPACPSQCLCYAERLLLSHLSPYRHSFYLMDPLVLACGFFKVLALLYTFSRFLTRCHILLAGIVEDSYALSVACKQTLTSLLRLLNAYNDESDYTVLSHVTSVSNLAPPVDSKTLYLQINYVAFDVPIKYQIHVSSFLAGMLKHF